MNKIYHLKKKTEINWNDASDLGLIYKINKEVLHPLGLAMTRDTFGSSNGLVVNDEPYTFTQDVIDKNENLLKDLEQNILNILDAVEPIQK